MDGIVVERRGRVALVTLDEAERMNSFDAEILRALEATFDGLMADDEVRAIVLTGSGKVFCAGADIAAFEAAIAAGEAPRFVLAATESLHPMLRKLHESDTVFVAAVNGVAAGGGLGLALAADARIGSDRARFAASYFGIGVSPDGGSTWLLPRIIGSARTRRFFLDNEVMSADEAQRLGLLDEVVDADALIDAAVALADRWSRWSRHSIGATKRLLSAADHVDFASQLEAERGLIAAAAGTADFREGIAAFREKRAPAFR